MGILITQVDAKLGPVAGRAFHLSKFKESIIDTLDIYL
jgi:hypothetical protein